MFRGWVPGRVIVLARCFFSLLAFCVLPQSPLNAAFAVSGTRTEQYASRIWRVQDGLPDNRIQALAQTSDGYLWIGTSGGLARFDGFRFVVYGRFNAPSMTDDNIVSLAVAADASLWAATEGGGLLHLQHGVFRTFGPEQGLSNEFVNAVLIDRQQRVWAATQRGLFVSGNGRFTRVDQPLHLRNISFSALALGFGNAILAAAPAGLFVFDQGELRPYSATADFGEVYRVRQTTTGTIWLGTSRGLKRLADSATSGFGAADTHPKPLIDAIWEDQAGSVWLGSRGDGLFKISGTHEISLRSDTTFPDNSVSAILEDYEHNMWIGTADGLVRLTKPDAQIVDNREGLSEDNVATVYRDHAGTIWITTITGKIFRCLHGRIQPFTLPSPVKNLQVIGAFQDRSGAFWFGTVNAGAVRIASGRATRFSMAEGLRNNGIQAFFEDQQGILWIGTSSGLSRWDGHGITNYYLESGLSYGWVRVIAADQNGDLLVGTDRGLNRFHAGHFVADPSFRELQHDRIWSIASDPQGTLWIGTRGAGLVRIQNGAASRITTRDGLPGNSIFQLIVNRNRLWMSGPSGISSASLSDLNAVASHFSASLSALLYSAGDGVEPAQMNGLFQPSTCIGANGELWFPSVKGAVHLDPSRLPNGFSFPVHLESILVDDRPVPVTPELRIGSGRRRLDLEFTAVSLRSPENLNFRYRLGSFDERWTTASRRHGVSYDNLPPGQYRFEAVASSPDRSSQTALTITVEPHFYQTPWAYLIAFALFIASIAGVLFLRERQARLRYHLRLEERSRIAREMHDTVIQGCLGVSTLVEAAVGCAATDHEQLLECLDNARVHLRLTVDEARQALSDLRQDSPGSLADALSASAYALGAEKHVATLVEVEGDPVALRGAIVRNLVLVAREAIRNAISHAAPTALTVRISFHAPEIEIAIEDDGCGFAAASDTLSKSGHFGILGMRERMEQMGGELEIESIQGYGTRVVCRLPLSVRTLQGKHV